jgi:hypothetical protein
VVTGSPKLEGGRCGAKGTALLPVSGRAPTRTGSGAATARRQAGDHKVVAAAAHTPAASRNAARTTVAAGGCGP